MLTDLSQLNGVHGVRGGTGAVVPMSVEQVKGHAQGLVTPTILVRKDWNVLGKKLKTVCVTTVVVRINMLKRIMSYSVGVVEDSTVFMGFMRVKIRQPNAWRVFLFSNFWILFLPKKTDNHFCIPDFPDIISVTSLEAANRLLPDLMGQYEKLSDFVTEGKPVYKKDGGTHFIFYSGKFAFTYISSHRICNIVGGDDLGRE